MVMTMPNTIAAMASIVWYPSVIPVVNGDNEYLSEPEIRPLSLIEKEPTKRSVIITSNTGQSIFPNLVVNFCGSLAIKADREKKTIEYKTLNSGDSKQKEDETISQLVPAVLGIARRGPIDK